MEKIIVKISKVLRLRIIGLLVVFIACSAYSSISLIAVPDVPVEEDAARKDSSRIWVDSVMKSLSPKEKIAQLFFVNAFSKTSKPDTTLEKLITKYNIGGLIFFKGGPLNEAQLTNHYQSLAKTKLLISIDGEWGVSMRLDSVHRFPYQVSMGAMRNDNLVYRMGKAVAEQCRMLGIHLNYAPVIDVNNNPKNPVINYRSFGEDMHNVTDKGIAYMKGMQDAGVIANAKHFPGHGDTDQDSHETLPLLTQNRQRIDSLELYPFVKLFKAGVKSVMVGHLEIPIFDTTKKLAASLSGNVVTHLLKDSLKYSGLVITDGLAMKGVSSYYKPGTLEVRALIAGNDVLLCSENAEAAIDSIEKAIVRDSLLTWADIDVKCRKVLALKYWAGLKRYRPINTDNLLSRLNAPEYLTLQREMGESFITVLKNEKNILPLNHLDTLKIAAISIGEADTTDFQTMISNYAPVDLYCIESTKLAASKDSLLKILSKYNLVIIGVHSTSQRPSQNYGISSDMAAFVDTLCITRPTIVAHIGNAYGLAGYKSINRAKALLLTYQNQPLFQELVAAAIFGGAKAKGHLPVTVNADFKLGVGFPLDRIARLQYTTPEVAGIDSKYLVKVDSVIKLGLDAQAYPGCQVLFAKDGKVFYNKSFGYHTYDSTLRVKSTDLYDIASVTKIAATTLAAMRLDDENKLDLNKKLEDYLTLPEGCNKNDLVLKNIMSHNAGLTPFIHYWPKTKVGDSLSAAVYSKVKSDEFPLRVADSLYIRAAYVDSIWNTILSSSLLDKKDYKYSDLGLMIVKQVVEKVSGTPLNDYMDKYYYKPMGMSTLGYRPLEHFSRKRIIPAEFDKAFRKQLVWGDVHDPNAAMLGGVAGHAGLFSNANDLAKLMQMLLDRGYYGGISYLSPSVVDKYTERHFEKFKNRRGLGFDKPEMPKGGPVCDAASSKSFGHTGFTGTMVWADPKNNMIFIFLSNRVNPDAENTKLRDMNIRTVIQQIVYEAIEKSTN